MDYIGHIIYVEFADRKGRGKSSHRLEPVEVVTTDGRQLYHYYLTHSLREGRTYCDPEDLDTEAVGTPITCTGFYPVAYWVAGGYESWLDIGGTYTWGVPGSDALAGSYTRRRLPRIPPEYRRRRRDGRPSRSRKLGPWVIFDDVCKGRTINCTVCQDYYDESENQPCSHVEWCHECGEFSTPDERCSHIRGPNRLPDPITTFCRRCGYKRVVLGPSSLFRTKRYQRYRGSCSRCHAKVADWAFLADLERLPPGTPLRLSCPWSHRMYEQEQREYGERPEFTFTVADLAVSGGTAGHGPCCYPLANRFRLQARCPVCGQFAGGYEFFNERNRLALLAALAAARGEDQGGERRQGVC